MNTRKSTDYTHMYTVLDALMSSALPQMELYCAIGRLINGRPEKGAAVAASEYLRMTYPDAAGFSPRNLRRMREFYRTYENTPELMQQAMQIGWTQNVIILEAELTLAERAWYIQAAKQFGWSKQELQQKISTHAHLEISLDNEKDVCYSDQAQENNAISKVYDQVHGGQSPDVVEKVEETGWMQSPIFRMEGNLPYEQAWGSVGYCFQNLLVCEHDQRSGNTYHSMAKESPPVFVSAGKKLASKVFNLSQKGEHFR